MAEKKEPSKLSRKIDAISRYVFLTEEGRPKSANGLYAFCLAILFALIDLACYAALPGVIDGLFEGAPMWLTNTMEFLVPALAGSLLCVSIFFLTKKNRNLVPNAYLWMAVFLIATLIAMAFIAEDREEFGFFWFIVGLPFTLSTVIGGAAAWALYIDYLKKHPLPPEKGTLPGTQQK